MEFGFNTAEAASCFSRRVATRVSFSGDDSQKRNAKTYLASNSATRPDLPTLYWYLLALLAKCVQDYVTLWWVLITFLVRHSRGEMYTSFGRLCVCLCVCLSVYLALAAFPHYCMDPDVTWGMVGVPCSCALLGGFAIGARLIDWVGFNVPLNTLLVISGTGFYGSNDPTNSVKALKEVMVLRIRLQSNQVHLTMLQSYTCMQYTVRHKIIHTQKWI